VRVFWLSIKTKVYGLSLVWPQNHWDGFLRFDLKTGGDGFLWFGLKTGGDGFSRFGIKIGGGGFYSLGLKTDSYGLMICASKSPRQFLGLGIKTKRVMICRLCHKTDGRMESARDTRRDLAACFMWKQVGLEFPSLTSRLVETRHGWCMWHHRGGYIAIN
jgi:hypothetical protein